jgi:hypothetical protein
MWCRAQSSTLPDKMAVVSVEAGVLHHRPPVVGLEGGWPEHLSQKRLFLRYYRIFKMIALVNGHDKRHWDGILRWHDIHIANGILEGINSLVQAAKAKARGYRSSHNLKAMIYLIAGKLDLLPST